MYPEEEESEEEPAPLYMVGAATDTASPFSHDPINLSTQPTSLKVGRARVCWSGTDLVLARCLCQSVAAGGPAAGACAEPVLLVTQSLPQVLLLSDATLPQSPGLCVRLLARCLPWMTAHSLPPLPQEWLDEASEDAEVEGLEEAPRALAKLASLVEAEDIDYVDVQGDAFEGLHQVGGWGWLRVVLLTC